MKLEKEQILQLKKVGVVVLITLGAVGSIYAFEVFKQSAGDLPDDFVSGYQEASVHGNKMMTFTRSVNRTVDEINSMDLAGSKKEPLQLIEEAKRDNERARRETRRMVDYIGELAVKTGNIDDPQKKNQAIELLALESEIIKKIAGYNDNMDDFLESLSQAIESGASDKRRSADRYLRAANLKIGAVNKLNEVFLRKAEDLNLQTSPQ